MFDRIVVPLDGSPFAEAALAPARELARAFHSRILVARALSPHGLAMATVSGGEKGGLERVDTADEYLQRKARELQTAGYDADMLLYMAEPSAGIARAAELDRAALIVMATHLRWEAAPTADVSTTLQVLARSRVPILAWRVSSAMEARGERAVEGRAPLLGHPASPLLVPLDGSPAAESVLTTAEEFARQFGQDLVLVRAIEPGRAAEEETAAEDDARTYMEGVRRDLEARGMHAITVTRKGMPVSVVQSAWREYDASMVVMASYGRSGFMGRLLGSVAARIVEEADVPVLVIRPEDEGLDLHQQAQPEVGPTLS